MSLSVSVALGTYNGARFVEEQVRSILEQELPPTELVVSDDGSTDDTLDRIRALFAGATTNVRLRILPIGERLGVTGNFERAVTACIGDLVALSDQDDVWHPNRLSAVVPRFESDPQLLLVASDARLVDAAGSPLGAGLFASLGLSAGEREQVAAGQAFDALIRRNLVTGAATVFRRRLLEQALPFPSEWVHDEWLAIIAAATGGLTLLDEQLIDYRQHGSNQIGVARRTPAYLVRRMLGERGDRYVRLAARSRALTTRLDALPVDPRLMDLADRKLAFEQVRAELSPHRLARVRPVLRERSRGSYRTLSSQGTLDVVRDILQPA